MEPEKTNAKCLYFKKIAEEKVVEAKKNAPPSWSPTPMANTQVLCENDTHIITNEGQSTSRAEDLAIPGPSVEIGDTGTEKLESLLNQSKEGERYNKNVSDLNQTKTPASNPKIPGTRDECKGSNTPRICKTSDKKSKVKSSTTSATKFKKQKKSIPQEKNKIRKRRRSSSKSGSEDESNSRSKTKKETNFEESQEDINIEARSSKLVKLNQPKSPKLRKQTSPKLLPSVTTSKAKKSKPDRETKESTKLERTPSPKPKLSRKRTPSKVKNNKPGRVTKELVKFECTPPPKPKLLRDQTTKIPEVKEKHAYVCKGNYANKNEMPNPLKRVKFKLCGNPNATNSIKPTKNLSFNSVVNEAADKNKDSAKYVRIYKEVVRRGRARKKSSASRKRKASSRRRKKAKTGRKKSPKRKKKRSQSKAKSKNTSAKKKSKN